MDKPIKNKKKPIVQKEVESAPINEEIGDKPHKISFEVWFKISGKKSHWKTPMETFAKLSETKEASIDDWNKLFERY